MEGLVFGSHEACSKLCEGSKYFLELLVVVVVETGSSYPRVCDHPDFSAAEGGGGEDRSLSGEDHHYVS